MMKETFEIDGIYENGTLKIMNPLPTDINYFVKIKFYVTTQVKFTNNI